MTNETSKEKIFEKFPFNIKFKKFVIDRELRRYILILLTVMSIISLGSTIIAYQTPEIKQTSVPIYEYVQRGTFGYKIFLKNNSLYETNELSSMGEVSDDIYFKKIIDMFNITFFYSFTGSEVSYISGSYLIEGKLKNKLWAKNFTFIPDTKFNSSFYKSFFTITFPLNITSYDELIIKINNETDTSVQDSTFYITAKVSIESNSSNVTIHDEFFQTLEIPWGKNTIEIKGNLTKIKNGEEIVAMEKKDSTINFARSSWSKISLNFIVLLMLFTVLTKGETAPQKVKQKQLKKIKKKYGEWMIDLVDTEPDFFSKQKKIPVKNIDDLVKISEEIGKPIFRFINENKHTFYVNDDQIFYIFIFS